MTIVCSSVSTGHHAKQHTAATDREGSLGWQEKERYTPAGVTPVHLLIEAETSSAFLRAARV